MLRAFLRSMTGAQVLRTKLCSELQTSCEREYHLFWVRASTRVLSVVCGVQKKIVVLNRKLFD